MQSGGELNRRPARGGCPIAELFHCAAPLTGCHAGLRSGAGVPRPSSRSKITAPGTARSSGDSSRSGSPRLRPPGQPSHRRRRRRRRSRRTVRWRDPLDRMCGLAGPSRGFRARRPHVDRGDWFRGAAIIVAPESSSPSLIACPTPRPRTSMRVAGPRLGAEHPAHPRTRPSNGDPGPVDLCPVGGPAPALRRAVPWVIHQLCRQPHHRLQQAVLWKASQAISPGCLNTVRPLRAVQRGLAESYSNSARR